MLKSSLWDYSDAYILVKGTITLIEQGAVAPAITENSKVIEKEIRIAELILINTLTRTFRESWSCKYWFWSVYCLFVVGFDSVFWKYILIFEEFDDFLLVLDCISCLICQYGWRRFFWA